MQRISITNPQNIIDGTAKKYYFKLRNTGGPKGDKGDKGDTGQTGPQGPQGDPCTVVVNSTATLEPGSNAYVTNTGSLSNAVLNFGIPKGDRGPQGAKGDKGDTGAQGETGPRGPQGERGTNATVYVGTTSTLNPGSQATVYNSGSDSSAVLNFGIPQGAKGDTGSQGPQGPTGPAGQNFAPTVVAELPATGDSSKLYLTPKAHTTQTATGNPITATVTEDAGAIESFQLDGDTFQQSYAGKNLLDVPNISTTNSGVEITVNNGVIGCSGKVTSSWGFNIAGANSAVFSKALPAGDYAVSMNKAVDIPIKVVFVDSESQTIGTATISAGGTSVAYTTPREAVKATVWSNAAQNTQVNISGLQIMVESGSSASSFEPYVGGQASPNPDYPQPIQTVTGKQTVEVVGKNLAKLKDGSYSWSPAGQSWNISNGVINATRTNSSYQGGAVNITTGAVARWAVEPATDSHLTGSGGSYTITFSRSGDVQTSPSSTARVCVYGFIYDANGNNTSGNGQMLVDLSTATTGTYTLNLASDRHLGALVCYSQLVSYSDVEFKVQIEKGSTATTYAPYSKQTLPIDLGSLELCKLGTYQDYIWKDGDDWKVHKALGKITLNGSEAWYSAGGNAPFGLVIDGALITTSDANPPLVYCDKFYPVSQTASWSSYESLISTNNINSSTKTIRIRYTAMANLSDFQAWLGTHNTTLYYVLATATDTVITDADLIAQLEAIRTASLENGTNTITNSATAPNLAGDMEVGYYGYNPTNRYDKYIWLDLNNNYEQIGS